jgi:hypothetical protein
VAVSRHCGGQGVMLLPGLSDPPACRGGNSFSEAK